MSSLDRLPQRSLVKAARDIAQVSLELKAAQRTTGQGGQLGYLVQSDEAWDLIETLPTTSGPAYESATYLVTYTGNGTQPFPIAIPSTDMRVNGETETNRLSVVPSSGLYVYSDEEGEVLVQTFELPDPDYFASPAQSAWRIDMLYRGAVTLRFKSRANATSDGTITIARTA